MDPLSVTASIVPVLQLSSKAVGYLTDVKDVSKEREKCAIEATNLHSLLLNLRFRLEEGSMGTPSPWYTTVQTLTVENGPLDQYKETLETLQGMMVDGGRLGGGAEAPIWNFRKEEIASILDRMEHLKTLIEIALQMDHFKLSQAMKDDTTFIRTYSPTMKSRVDKIQQDQDAVERRRLLAWISPTDYPAQQSDVIKRRQEGTGQWFLDACQVTSWLNTPKETLFCPGIPGAGKTIIAAVMIDHLLKLQENLHGVAYIYCNYKAQDEQDVSSMLAAILKQLVQAWPSGAKLEPVERLHRQHDNQGTRPSLDEVFSALQAVIMHYTTVHIVIDALDECRGDGTRRQFLAKLRDLQAEQDIRLMATSRFMPEVEDEFREALRLEMQASKEDVKRFVAGQTYRLPKCIQRDPALQDMVQDKIIEAVDGMFLLARLHTDSLLDKRTPKDVKSALDRLSKGSAALNSAYRDALQRIEGQLAGDYELAKKVLSWITFAKRPLTVAEICCALAVEPEEAELDPENMPDVDDLVSVCAGLVVVDQETSIIRLVHHTTQEYFENIKDDWNTTAQLDITTTCLTYLSFNRFKSGGCATDKEFEERLQQNKFLDYAAKHWGEHATKTENKVCKLAYLFLVQRGLVLCSTQVMYASEYKYPGYSQVCGTGLHVTAWFGLPNISRVLLLSLPPRIKKEIIDWKDTAGQTPLHVAALQGNNEIVGILVDNGADVNAQGGYYGNALQAASFGGHQRVVKLLVDLGADVNAQGGHHGNALCAASVEAHEQTVKLLLDGGANANAQGGYYGNAAQAALEGDREQIIRLYKEKTLDSTGGWYGNALYAASSRGHESVVRLLVDKGADIHMQGGEYGNALYAASSGGHELVVRLLVDKGADVNAQGGKDGNALMVASLRGYTTIVKLLVNNGADVNRQGGPYGNALCSAAKGGHELTVQLLLNLGANVNAQCEYYSNALCAASLEGHELIVKLLLDNGADVNVQGGYYGDALQAASFGGHEQVVKLLADLGADVNRKGGNYGNALQAASTGGHEQVVKLLVELGADINAQSGHFGSALCAASFGLERMVKLLVELGADVNAQGGYYGNALQAASFGSHKHVAKQLVDLGANVNAQGGHHGNALQAASLRGYEPLVKLLLDGGADVNAQGGYYGNALQAASHNGHEPIVKLLLDEGAEVNAQGGYYGNALQAASKGGGEQIVRLPNNMSADAYAASSRRYEQIVKLLLNKGADVNAQGGYYGNALRAASLEGEETIVRVLLGGGAVAFEKSTEAH